MTDNRTSITIIIPHRNMPDSLERLLGSIGIHEDVQVIVIDDASDLCRDRLAAVQRKWKKKVLFPENGPQKQGAGAARNTGLRFAAGRWILFADADDFFCEGWHELVSTYLDTDADIVFFPPLSMNSDTNMSSDRHIPYTQMIDGFRFGLEHGEDRLRYRWAPVWSKLIRTELIRNNQILFDETQYSNDVMFSVKAGLAAGKITVADRPIYCICEHGHSLTKDIGEDVLLQRLEINCKRQAFLRDRMTKEQFKTKAEKNETFYIKYALRHHFSVKTLLSVLRMYMAYRIPVLVWDDIKDKARELGWLQYGKNIRGSDINWTKSLMIPTVLQKNPRSQLSWERKKSAKLAQTVQELDDGFHLSADPELGKVTDCGYDAMACIFTKIPSGSNFIFEADIIAENFIQEPGPVNQEAFGLFIRDTMDRDSETGIHYSNMAAVGGYYGRRNVFGRSGIMPEDISHIRNILLYSKVNRAGGAFEKEPMHYRIDPQKPLLLHLKMIRLGNEITAIMRNAAGRDLLAPEYNGGSAELSGTGGVVRNGDEYKITLPADAFCSRDKRHVYLGLFTTKGSEITVSKSSVRITILNKSKMQPKEPAKPMAHPEDEFPEPVPGWDKEENAENGRILYAYPDGHPDTAGSEKQPLDIRTAVSRCADGETVFLMPGTYQLTDDLTLDREHSGRCGARRHLCCGSAPEQKAVLDFSGTASALRITGDFWDIRNIRVTNGRGIIIEGSYNRIQKCHAFRNLETGILIRHHLNESPRSVWPAYNLVEDCLSYENCDIAEFNADGFACKVAAGEGNCFRGCISWLNADDGFDLFTKNRKTGAVRIENCQSFLNGYKLDAEGNMTETAMIGNGFKLGGSGMYIEHQVTDCLAEGNKGIGFTSNSNPFLHLERCIARGNKKENIRYLTYRRSKNTGINDIINCRCDDPDQFDLPKLLRHLNTLREGQS